MNHETLFNAAANPRKIDTIIVHCAAVRRDSGVTVDDITQWHLKRKFRDIGYHYVVDEKGRVWKGRPLEEMGAHCKGHNRNSIGICYIGGLDDNGQPCDTRTPAQQLAIKHLIGLLIHEYKIYDVYGHRDLSPDVNGDGQITSVDWTKMCPCYDAHQEWLLYLREMALVSRNYMYAQMHDGESIHPELQNLCDAAEEYLKNEWRVPTGPEIPAELAGSMWADVFGLDAMMLKNPSTLHEMVNPSGAPSKTDNNYNPETDDDASFSLMNNPNDTNPVPPVPDALSVDDDETAASESSDKVKIAPVYKINLSGWRGMNWRRWGWRGYGMMRQ